MMRTSFCTLACQIAFLYGRIDLLPDVGDQVGAGQDGPVGTSGQGRHHDLIVTAEDADLALDLLEQGHQEGHVAAGILDAHHVVQVSHPLSRPPLEVGARALGDVVEDDGQADFVDRLEVFVDLVEGRFEVEGGHHQGCRGPGVPGVSSQGYGVPRAGAPSADHHRHPTPHLVNGDVNHQPPLRLREVHEFSGSARRHYPIHVGQNAADQSSESLLVNPVIPGEGRNQGGEDTFEPIGFLGHNGLLE